MDNIINKVGLEAEFFLTGKGGKLLYPGDHGFSTDEFIILGEFRAKPGKTRAETFGNFYSEYAEVLTKAYKKGFDINLDGVKRIDPTKNAEILRKMGTKAITESKNIYGTDILELTDNIIDDGKIVGRYISTGLHIHFSSSVIVDRTYPTEEKYLYSPVNIPITFGEGVKSSMNLWKRDEKLDAKELTLQATANRITKPVVEYFVKELDKNILKDFVALGEDSLGIEFKDLKFRHPGFYEMKPYGGFEYRSLPFSWYVLENLYEIVDFSFNLLENL